MVPESLDSVPRLLLVDDHPEILRALTRELRRSFEVTAVGSAEQAIVLLARGGFDVLLTDLDMPGHDGIWLLERVRADFPTVCRLVISGRPEEALAQLCENELAEGALQKPFDPSSVSHRIDSAMKRRGAAGHCGE